MTKRQAEGCGRASGFLRLLGYLKLVGNQTFLIHTCSGGSLDFSRQRMTCCAQFEAPLPASPSLSLIITRKRLGLRRMLLRSSRRCGSAYQLGGDRPPMRGRPSGSDLRMRPARRRACEGTASSMPVERSQGESPYRIGRVAALLAALLLSAGVEPVGAHQSRRSARDRH